MEPADRGSHVGFWAGGDQAGLLQDPMPAGLQHSTLPIANPYWHCPPRADVPTAPQAVANEAVEAAGCAHTH